MAGIIKVGGSGGDRGLQAAAFNFDDMTDKANAYLDQVRRQAAEIIVKADEQSDQVRRRAEEQGRQAAMQAAEKLLRAKFDQQFQTLLPALEKAIESMRQEKQAWFKRWEENAVRLALAIAARLVRRQLSQSPEIAVDLVREALELAAGGDRLKLYLNPQDYEAFGGRVHQLASQMSKLAPADIIPDPQVSRGGCLLSTQFGSIDQQFEAQLARIEEELI